MFLRFPQLLPMFQLGNHDQHRIASRVGEEYVETLNMLLLLLPGTPTTYQGEEIGMKNIFLTYEQTVDPEGKNAGPVSLVSNNGTRTCSVRTTEIRVGLLK